jgi:hypothetical protein
MKSMRNSKKRMLLEITILLYFQKVDCITIVVAKARNNKTKKDVKLNESGFTDVGEN